MKDLNKIKEFFSKSLKEMEFGDPLEQIFMNYAGKTIEMEFDDPNSDWSNLIGDLEEYFPGDKLSDFMSSKELEIYLDDYNIRLIDPIMDREVDPSIVKRGKAKMDIDAMRKAANLPPLDDPISMNEHTLVMDDTITPDMWDREKIKVGIESKRITNPFWFTKPHKIIDFNSRMDMISFDHPAKQKLSLNWVNSFLKDNHKVDMSAEPEGFLSTKYAKSPSAKLKMNDEIKEVNLKQSKLSSAEYQKAKKLKDFKASDWKWNADEDLYIKLTEAKSFTDYSNNELAAYCKNNPSDKKAAKELHKRSQKLKNLSRTDVNEQDDHVDPMVAKAYKNYIKAKKEGNGEKAYRYYSKKLNNTYSTIADRDAIEAILKKKYGSALEESINEGVIGDIQSQLDDLGVEYKMSHNPFKVIYKPVNKDDRWYKDFDDIIFRYNLGGVVKTSMNEGAVEIMDAFNDVMDLVKQHSRRLSDDDSYAFGLKLKAWFNKNILDEATKEEETEFHKKLDDLVHKTFGKRKGEMEENMLSLDDQAKAYYLEKLKKGEIDKLPDNPKAAFLAQMTKDQIAHDEETLRRERGLEEIKDKIFNRLKK